MKRTTANRRIKEWQALLDQTKDLPKPAPLLYSCSNTNNTNTNTTKQDDDDDDPFDCSDLIIRETAEIVKDRLKQHVKEWQDLDSRLVVPNHQDGRPKKKIRPTYHLNEDSDNEQSTRTSRNNDGNDGNDDDDGEGTNNQDQNQEDDTSVVDAPSAGDYGGATWGFHANRIRLPDFFDYESKGPPPQSQPQSPVPQDSEIETGTDSHSHLQPKPKRRQVVSLEDPTQLLDYEAELWKIFQKVPIEEEIEKEVTEGAICTNILELNQEIDVGLREYTRLDGHALSRLRKKDRHHWPRTRITNGNGNGNAHAHAHANSNVSTSNNNDDDDDDKIDCATVKFEFWRRHTKRFGSDPNKCEMEFLSTQTLQDVHDAIVDCTEDELFLHGSSNMNGGASASDNLTTSSPTTSRPPSSGYFFMEDTFYTTGETDYVTPILEWLEQDTSNSSKRGRPKKNKKCRKSHLKINPHPSFPLSQKPMHQTLLGDIPLRLGIRYVHVCNGDVETSLFLSDITMRFPNENISLEKNAFPLIHDIWTTSTSSLVHGVGLCEGCHHCPATVLTIEDEFGDGGPTPLCQACFRTLHFDGDKDGNGTNGSGNNGGTNGDSGGGKLRYNNFKVVPMSVLQNLRGLCVGHDYKEALFTCGV